MPRVVPVNFCVNFPWICFYKENHVKKHPPKIHTKIHLEIHLSPEATLRATLARPLSVAEWTPMSLARWLLNEPCAGMAAAALASWNGGLRVWVAAGVGQPRGGLARRVKYPLY